MDSLRNSLFISYGQSLITVLFQKYWKISDNLKTMQFILDVVHVTETTINTKQGVDLPCTHDRLSNTKHIVDLPWSNTKHSVDPNHALTSLLDVMFHAYEMQICHFMLCHATCIIRATCNIYKFRIIIFPIYNFHLSQFPC